MGLGLTLLGLDLPAPSIKDLVLDQPLRKDSPVHGLPKVLAVLTQQRLLASPSRASQPAVQPDGPPLATVTHVDGVRRSGGGGASA